MTTKEYLYQLRNIDKRIQDKLLESMEWREIAMSNSINIPEVNVQSSPKQDVMADAVAKAVDYEREASQIAVKMTELKYNIIKQIDGINDEATYNVLKEHFVQQVGIGTMADKYLVSYNCMKYRIKNAIAVFEKKYGNKWDRIL